MKIALSLAALAAELALAACAAAPPAAEAPKALTCTDIRTTVARVVSDLKSEDAVEQEAWVDGMPQDSIDFHALVAATRTAVTGVSRLETDAARFNRDARDYQAANSPYLQHDWRTRYHRVNADIDKLATDCQQSTAPPS